MSFPASADVDPFEANGLHQLPALPAREWSRPFEEPGDHGWGDPDGAERTGDAYERDLYR